MKRRLIDYLAYAQQFDRLDATSRRARAEALLADPAFMGIVSHMILYYYEKLRYHVNDGDAHDADRSAMCIEALESLLADIRRAASDKETGEMEVE